MSKIRKQQLSALFATKVCLMRNENNIKEFMDTKTGTNFMHNISKIATALESIVGELKAIRFQQREQMDLLECIKNTCNDLPSK